MVSKLRVTFWSCADNFTTMCRASNIFVFYVCVKRMWSKKILKQKEPNFFLQIPLSPQLPTRAIRVSTGGKIWTYYSTVRKGRLGTCLYVRGNSSVFVLETIKCRQEIHNMRSLPAALVVTECREMSEHSRLIHSTFFGVRNLGWKTHWLLLHVLWVHCSL